MHDVDAVEQCGTPKVKRACPVCWSMPTRPSASPSTRLTSPRRPSAPRSAVTATKASIISAKYSAGPNCERELDDRRGEERERDRAERARDERADRGGGERGAARGRAAPSGNPRSR